MKRVFTVFALIITSLCFTSCGIFTKNVNNISKEQASLEVEIFQTLSSTSALAYTTSNNYKIVKIVTENEVYYDGKTISGWFKLIDTYTYETKDGNIKTVPVFQKMSELRRK